MQPITINPFELTADIQKKQKVGKPYNVANVLIFSKFGKRVLL